MEIHRKSGISLSTSDCSVSAGNVWIFGASADGDGTGTWHFDGRSWRRVAGAAGAIYRASAISRRDIWAITTGTKSDPVLRYDGKRWRPVRTGHVLAAAREDGMHALRHFYASVLLDSGESVKALAEYLGHADLRAGTRVANQQAAEALLLSPSARLFENQAAHAAPSCAGLFGLAMSGERVVRGQRSRTNPAPFDLHVQLGKAILAEALKTSPRTLKRQLAAEGTSFSTLVDEERRQQAMILLRASGSSLKDVADRLGYANLANFTRAFHRWTGTTPSEHRSAAGNRRS